MPSLDRGVEDRPSTARTPCPGTGRRLVTASTIEAEAGTWRPMLRDVSRGERSAGGSRARRREPTVVGAPPAYPGATIVPMHGRSATPGPVTTPRTSGMSSAPKPSATIEATVRPGGAARAAHSTTSPVSYQVPPTSPRSPPSQHGAHLRDDGARDRPAAAFTDVGPPSLHGRPPTSSRITRGDAVLSGRDPGADRT